MTWTIHIGGSTYPATFEKVVQELDEHEKGYFTLQNTEASRNVVDSVPDCTIKFLGATVFQGVIGAWQIESERYLKCEVYDKVYYLMDKKTHPDPASSAVIVYNSTQCDTILTAVAGEVTGVSAGSCPSDSISVKFNRAGCFNIVKFLAQSVNKNFYSTNANTINIADRGSNKGRLEIIGVPSRRKVSNFKKRDKVVVRGVDADGNDIEGTAGTGDDVATFTEKKATDETTLDNIAAYKLDKINKSSHGVKLQSPIEFSYSLNPGDTVTINKEMYGLSGSYKIWRITKYTTYSDIEIDSAEVLLEKILDNQQDMEDYGIYSSSEAVLDNPTGSPSAPTGVETINQMMSIKVKWSPNSEADLDKYKVYRNTSNDSGSANLASTQDKTTYIDKIINTHADTYYYYWIKAVDRVGNESDFSSVESGQASLVLDDDITEEPIVGKDFRTAANVGEAGGGAGIRIFVDGIEAYSGGTNKTFWVSSADGNLYAAEGAVKIDNEGLHIIGSGQFLIFRSGDLSIRGAVYINNDENLTIHGTSGKVEVRGNLYPIVDEGFDLGLEETRWDTLYVGNLIIPPTGSDPSAPATGQIWLRDDL